ncbi:uncharacterized protein BJ212DRAFT_1487940 [Suillus subaureus]|uniref:Uncharacterized protein n=1 Tax=Suillus subaureus TaxID=48587 RepID=A0A9P7DQH8_9AGAM|nr:uncharacterized protein BJ212DRAFT_1487940 [Suillus subaureus]KAG1800606.1 hypothetical protein BJ212DRAFT_1487940 [Suillus subaureus]
MAMTNSTSNSPCGLIDSAMLMDSQSFSISQILVDVAVSTEDTLPTEVSGGSCLSEEWKNLNGIPCIMGGMRALTASLGGMLHGCTSADFPWKTLPKELAHLGYVLTNYPDDTLIPGELHPSLSRTKGIHDLSHHHRVNLVNHLKAGTLTIQAVKSDAARTHLTTSKDPIIIREAPSACSLHSHGQHAFADGQIDRKGLPRLSLPSSLPTSCRHTQVIVEITRPPPRPASQAVPKPFAVHISDPIPHIASVKGRPSSSKDDDMTGSANDEDESELQFSDSESHPGMKLNLSDYYSDPTNDQASSPPAYLPALSPAAMDSEYMQGGYVQEQFGGGQYKDPPTELTPSRLHSKIKPTSRNVGIARDAAIQYLFSRFLTLSLLLELMHPSHHNSPFVEAIPAQCPAQTQDLFSSTLAPTSQQLQPVMPQNLDVFTQQPQYGALDQNSMVPYNLLTIPSGVWPLWPMPSPLMEHEAPRLSPSPLASYLQLPTSPLLMPTVAGPSSQGVSANSLPPQGAVLMMHIIPPTPLKPFELLALPSAGVPRHRAVTFSPSATGISQVGSDVMMDDDNAPIAGQCSSETNSALEEGCAALDAIVNDTAKNTMKVSTTKLWHYKGCQVRVYVWSSQLCLWLLYFAKASAFDPRGSKCNTSTGRTKRGKVMRAKVKVHAESVRKGLGMQWELEEDDD